MRRQNSKFGKVVLAVIVVVILCIAVFKIASKNEFTKEYVEYVKLYEEAVYSYADRDLPKDYPAIIIDYDELTNELVKRGYIDEFDDKSVEISAYPITLSKSDYKITFYNYNDTTTFENRFELQFKKNNKQYTCTKIDCK